ncbi:MAG: putative sulfoacetate transporter SauU [Verrucomicrobiota bacterium]
MYGARHRAGHWRRRWRRPGIERESFPNVHRRHLFIAGTCRHTARVSSSPTPPTQARKILLGFVLTLTAIAYLDRVCISAAKPAIKAALALTDSQMGYIFSAFTFAYALFEIPSGWMADRFGPRLMITRIVVLWSLMTALTGMASGFLSLLTVRLLFGLGEAGMFPGLARAFSRWIPGRSHGSVFGLAITAALLSGALTQKLVVRLMEVMSWRWTFPLFGAVGMIWAAAWFLWFRNDPREHSGVNAAELEAMGTEPHEAAHTAVPWRLFLRSKNLIALCLVYFGIIYGWYFYLTWMPDYLQRAHGFSADRAANFSALPLVTMALGVFCGGYLTDALTLRWGLVRGRRICGLVSLPLAAVLVCVAAAVGSGEAAAVFLALAAGLASLSVASAWAASLDLGGRHAGVVSGAMNMLGNLGGALSPVVVGHCVQHWEHTHRWAAWHVPILTTALCYVISFGCWAFLEVRRIES